MSRTFKRSPALVCSIVAFVAVYVVYGLLLVPSNKSNLSAQQGARMRFSALAAPPGSVATLVVRYTQEELERVLSSEEARKAAEPRDLMKRLKEIGLQVQDDGGSVDAKQGVGQGPIGSTEVVQASGLTAGEATSREREIRAGSDFELDGGKLVLKGPEIEDGIIPGKPIPPECHAEPHTDYDGVAVTWGLTNPQENAADCCQACLDQARDAKDGELRCNVWVYCPAEEGCYSPDIYEHTQFECWLKQSDAPRVNFKGRYPPDYREAHPECTEDLAQLKKMQASKKVVATVKEKVNNASAKIDKKMADAKFAVQEKVEKMKAHGDEGAKAEASERRNDRKEEAGRRAEQKERQNKAAKERATDPNPGPIGDRPTPADLGMTSENPYNPAMKPGASAGPTIPNYLGPVGNSVA